MIANLDSLCIILQKLLLVSFCAIILYFYHCITQGSFFLFSSKDCKLSLSNLFVFTSYFGQLTNSKILFSFLDIMYNNDITLFFYRMFAWKLYEQTMKRRWIPILFYILNHCSYSQEIMIHSNVYLYTDNNISQHHLWCADIHLRSRQICKMVITTIS